MKIMKILKNTFKKKIIENSKENAKKKENYINMSKKMKKANNKKIASKSNSSMTPSDYSAEDSNIALQAISHSEPPMQAVAHIEPPMQAVAHIEPPKPMQSTVKSNQIIDLVEHLDGLPPDMGMKFSEFEFDKAVEILKTTKNLLIFTGAGVSASSLSFPNVPALEVYVKKAIRDRDYYKILRTIHGKQFRESYLFGSLLPILRAEPNTNHINLTKLAQIYTILGLPVSIITQNLDNLHEKTKPLCDLIHIHGTITLGNCSKCSKQYDYQKLLEQYQAHPERHEIFRCATYNKKCDGIISPAMVEYGEEVTEYDRAAMIASQADTIMVLGTSLRVSPANQLVNLVKNNGGRILLFTRSTTPKDNLASVHLHGNLSETLPQILDGLKAKFHKDKTVSSRKRTKISKV